METCGRSGAYFLCEEGEKGEEDKRYAYQIIRIHMADKKAAPTGAIIAGIAGLTAAAIGAYYLYGHKDSKKHRAKVKSWMLKAKGEVLEELEKVQDVTESAY